MIMVVHSQRTKKRDTLCCDSNSYKLKICKQFSAISAESANVFLYSNHAMRTGDGNCEEREWDTKKNAHIGGGVTKTNRC